LIELNKERLVEVGKEIDSLGVEMEYWRGMRWRTYEEIKQRYDKLLETRDRLRAEQTKLQSDLPRFESAAVESKETVYTFLSRILSMPEDHLRFFVFIVPACLYDILAPFCIAILFLFFKQNPK